jgi:hypothetical protein
MEAELFWQLFENISNNKFNENQSSSFHFLSPTEERVS